MIVPKCASCGGAAFSHIDRSHGDERYILLCCSKCGAVLSAFR